MGAYVHDVIVVGALRSMWWKRSNSHIKNVNLIGGVVSGSLQLTTKMKNFNL